jgi:hypothetical protein
MPDFVNWSPEELRKAETAAQEFLGENSGDIAATFEQRLALLAQATAWFRLRSVGFEERMLCLSLIQELSRGLADSAGEFFEMGCAPAVANLVLG